MFGLFLFKAHWSIILTTGNNLTNQETNKAKREVPIPCFVAVLRQQMIMMKFSIVLIS